MGFGRGGAFFNYNTPTVPQGWVSQPLGCPFHKHPHTFRVQHATVRPATNGGFVARQLPATLASSDEGVPCSSMASQSREKTRCLVWMT